MSNYDLTYHQVFGFYEFFAGGGMARLGLGDRWECLFANDLDAKKAVSYRENFNGAPEFLAGDIRDISTRQIPGWAMLAWASFPCQDLSLAGAGAGLDGARSGVFWSFHNLMRELEFEGRNPPIIVLENVAGWITSHGDEDLINLIRTFADDGYRIGAVQIDGAFFVARSRPRLCIVAVDERVMLPAERISLSPSPLWHPRSLQAVIRCLPARYREYWLWWRLTPPPIGKRIETILEEEPEGVRWHSREETEKLLGMMSPSNFSKVEDACRSGLKCAGTVYKRTRNGAQRAEVRFDGLSGRLRTPAGGSSRQIVMVVEGGEVRSRLISPRETARLMGLPDSYTLPERYNDA